LRREGLDLAYAVLGPGDPADWRALAEREGVADLVAFDGTREAGEGVRRWLDGLDIHLQPSFQEGLPRATIEAMSRGVACIGSTCGGIPELLSPERTHRPGDAAGLADCVRRLASDPALIAETSRIDLEAAQSYHADALRSRRDEVYSRLRAMAEGAAAGGRA
jgi:glycosyltransferase involved in cell wall biosynthesis